MKCSEPVMLISRDGDATRGGYRNTNVVVLLIYTPVIRVRDRSQPAIIGFVKPHLIMYSWPKHSQKLDSAHCVKNDWSLIYPLADVGSRLIRTGGANLVVL